MGDITPGYVFKEKDAITVEKLNQLVGQAQLKALRVAQIEGLQEALDAKASARQVENDLSWKAAVGHVHRADDIEGLGVRLQQRNGVGHKHTTGDVDRLAEEVAQKSPRAHTHGVVDVAALGDMLTSTKDQLETVGAEATRISELADVVRVAQEAGLDRLAERTHGHALSEIGGLQEGLDRLAPATHMHEQGHMKGLAEALAGRADEGHPHELAHVNGLLGALNDKAAAGHVHSVFEISGTNVSGTAASYSAQDAIASNDFNFRGKKHDLQSRALPTIGAIKQIVRQMVTKQCTRDFGSLDAKCTTRVE